MNGCHPNWTESNLKGVSFFFLYSFSFFFKLVFGFLFFYLFRACSTTSRPASGSRRTSSRSPRRWSGSRRPSSRLAPPPFGRGGLSTTTTSPKNKTWKKKWTNRHFVFFPATHQYHVFVDWVFFCFCELFFVRFPLCWIDLDRLVTVLHRNRIQSARKRKSLVFCFCWNLIGISFFFSVFPSQRQNRCRRTFSFLFAKKKRASFVFQWGAFADFFRHFVVFLFVLYSPPYSKCPFS